MAISKSLETVGINMQKKTSAELSKRAKAMSLSKSAYCNIILQQWIDSGKRLTISE